MANRTEIATNAENISTAKIGLNATKTAAKDPGKPLKVIAQKSETVKSGKNATATETKPTKQDKVKAPKIKREILTTLLSRKKFYKILINKLEG